MTRVLARFPQMPRPGVLLLMGLVSMHHTKRERERERERKRGEERERERDGWMV